MTVCRGYRRGDGPCCPGMAPVLHGAPGCRPTAARTPRAGRVGTQASGWLRVQMFRMRIGRSLLKGGMHHVPSFTVAHSKRAFPPAVGAGPRSCEGTQTPRIGLTTGTAAFST